MVLVVCLCDTQMLPLTVITLLDRKARYSSKIVIFAPLRRSLSEYCHNAWYRKTRMVWLSDSEKILKTCLLE